MLPSIKNNLSFAQSLPKEKKLPNKIHSVGVKYRCTACILSACMLRKTKPKQQSFWLNNEKFPNAKLLFSYTFNAVLACPLSSSRFWFCFTEVSESFSGSTTKPWRTQKCYTEKMYLIIEPKTVSVRPCIMHTLGGSQERSVLGSLLLQQQSHRPGLKIFMIRMT